MILLTHIALALSSILLTVYTMFSPTKLRLNIINGLAISTLASGTYLVLSTHSSLSSACLSGVTFLAIVGSGALVARRRLATATNI